MSQPVNGARSTHVTQSNDRRDRLDVPRLLSPFILRTLPSGKMERTKKVDQNDALALQPNSMEEQPGSRLDDRSVIVGSEATGQNSKDPGMKQSTSWVFGLDRIAGKP